MPGKLILIFCVKFATLDVHDCLHAFWILDLEAGKKLIEKRDHEGPKAYVDLLMDILKCQVSFKIF